MDLSQTYVNKQFHYIHNNLTRSCMKDKFIFGGEIPGLEHLQIVTQTH